MKTANILWRDLLRQVRLFPLAAFFVTALPLAAQVPSLINYQGRLTDGSGSPVSGNRTMAVRLYDAATGGNMTYEETIGTVGVANGTYSFQFGASGNGIVSVLSGQDYLALTVNGTEETTRTRLLAVPYALKAKESADTQTLNSQVTSLNGTVAGLSASQTTLAGNVTTLSTQVSGVIINASAALGAVSELSGNVTSLGTQVNTLSGNVTALASGQNALTANVTTLSTQVSGVSSNASAALGAVSELSGNVTSLGTQVNTLSGNVTALESGQNALTTQVSGVSSNASAALGAVSALSGNVTSLGTQVNTLSGNVTSLASGQNALTANVTALSTQVSGASSNASAALGAVGALRAELVAAGVLAPANMVIVAGGTLPQGSGIAGQTVATFQIGKYEVTWGEWKEVRAWAVANGYSDLAGVGDTYRYSISNNLPVIYVSWYDVVKWMNAKSEKDGLTPVYQVSGATYKTGQGAPTVNRGANGYRLPTEKEWEWAARGGLSSQGYIYSGSNGVSAVAWYDDNGSAGTKAVGTKAANELGIHDMSGNVWEWCEDVEYSSLRRFRGGSWSNDADGCTVAYRFSMNYPDFRYDSLGFRLARSSGN